MALQKQTIPAITTNGLELLGQIFGLRSEPSHPDLEDVVLVAIDFEYFQNIKEDLSLNLECQAGLAILDTRNILDPEPVISTQNFATGQHQYCARASKMFHFGKSITTRQQDMLENINSLIPQSRNIILVGHNILQDLRALKALGFDFEVFPVGVLDTELLVREVIPFWTGTLGELDIPLLVRKVIPSWTGTLGELLTELNCPYGSLHSAGNDAHFTLRALILLAVRDCKTRTDAEYEERLDVLERIAYASIPACVDPAVVIERKKKLSKKREAKLRIWNRHRQSIIGEIEAQERICAERASKRLARDSEESGLDWFCHASLSTWV